MVHTNLTPREGRLIVKLILVGMFLQLGVIGFVFSGQHNGCERSKLDRAANAQGWRGAQKARISALAKDRNISFDEAKALIRTKPKPRESANLSAARTYESIASGLERRSKVGCPGDFLGEVL